MPKIVELTNNTTALYPVRSEIFIKDITLQYGKMIDVKFRGAPDVRIPLEDCIGKEQTLKVGENHHITLSAVPSGEYARSGMTSIGWITVKDTDIPWEGVFTVEDWLPKVPEDDRYKIEELIGTVPGNYPGAVQILEHLTYKLNDHKGTPTDKMQQSPPLEQYRMAIAGESRAQCNNIVEMFVYFCHALGIPARRVNLWQGGCWTSKVLHATGYNLLTAPGHTVAEIYDDKTNRWIFMDPMYGIIRAVFRGDDFIQNLTVVELQTTITNKKHVSHITFQYSDYFKTPPFSGGELTGIYQNCLNPTQRIGYVIP